TKVSRRSCANSDSLSEGLRLLKSSRLDFNVNIDQRDGCRRDARNARGLRQGARTDVLQLLLHFAREPADVRIIEPIWDGALLGLLQSLDGTPLLVQIAGVLDLGL